MAKIIYDRMFSQSCERYSNSLSAYRKRDGRVPADSYSNRLLSRTTRKDSGHSNRRPTAAPTAPTSTALQLNCRAWRTYASKRASGKNGSLLSNYCRQNVNSVKAGGRPVSFESQKPRRLYQMSRYRMSDGTL